MARSKQRKHKKHRHSTFYEALPLATLPPTALPHVRDHAQETVAALLHLWHHFYETNRSFKLRQLLQSVQPQEQLQRLIQLLSAQKAHASRWLVAHWPQAKHAIHSFTIGTQRLATRTARTSLGVARVYGPALGADAWRHSRRFARTTISKRARLLYVALAITGLIALAVTGTMIAISTINAYANDISSPAALLAKKKTGTTILDRNGQVLFEGYGGQATKVMPLSEMPQALRDATLAAEDPDFYDHPGFSWRGTARAVWVNLTHHGRVEGGSTLTQQLVKNALLTSDKKFQRKYQELLLATKLESRYSKDQILEMYLNEIYYGQGSSGIAAASQTYFHKAPRDLTLGESALLAGLPLGPGRFDPNFDLEAATGRRNYVLSRLVEFNKITKAQAEAAKAQPMRLASIGAPSAVDTGTDSLTVYAKKVKIQAPHFVFYILDQLRAIYGEEMIEQGGITVQTTLDLNKQTAAEDIIARQIGNLADRHVTNGGLISLEPSSGDILAMVGSTNYNAPGFGNVNVILSNLQPGSTFKPIAYATAFKKGWTGATHVDDTPMMDLTNGDGTPYIPQNYDGKFRGSVSLRRALANSLNIPALKVLQFAGIPETVQTAKDLGVNSLADASQLGLSLVLGGREVKPIDMASVYATFANSGMKVTPKSILKVSDKHGKDITRSTPSAPKQVLDARITYMITNILSDNNTRVEEFGLNSPLKLSRPAAVKTGTTNDFRDNWTIGYTPQITTAVWVGNNDHTPMLGVDGVTGAAPIWHEFMETALADLPIMEFSPPDGVTLAKICAGDGGLANPWDSAYDEVFLSEALPTKHCNSFAKLLDLGENRRNPDGPDPSNPPIIDESSDRPRFPWSTSSPFPADTF